MSVLRAFGFDFDVDAFLSDSPWTVDAVFHRGESGTSGGRKALESGFNLSVSKASFDEFANQQADAITFLERHAAEVQRLVSFSGVAEVILDFGIARRDAAAQSDRFSAELVRLAGRSGLSLELSTYSASQPIGK